MQMKSEKIHIGTSGWHYKHWKGTFYPADIKAAEQFECYARHFSTVELNNSFYRLPAAKNFDAWWEMSPANFIFSVKASRFITHMKKLKVGKKEINELLQRAGHLKEKLGPVLFQLPPLWKINTERLEHLLAILPTGYRYTIEFRNATWYDQSVYGLLKKYNCAFCVYELEHHLSPIVITSDFVYVRLHGPGNKYQGSYSSETLAEWAGRIREWQILGKDIYVYFDNDQLGYAAYNAKTLLEMVSEPLK